MTFPRHREGVSDSNSNKTYSQEKKDVTLLKKKNNKIMATKTAVDTDMINVNQETMFNKVKFSYVLPGADLKHTSLNKKLILCKRNPKRAVSWKVKKLYRELENSDKRLINSVDSGGLYNAIL